MCIRDSPYNSVRTDVLHCDKFFFTLIWKRNCIIATLTIILCRGIQVWNVLIEWYVAANCLIQVQSYSAYGRDSSCSPRVGYVKLNRVYVWRASWCGSYSSRRGVNILRIDPFSCSLQSSANFDTHDASSNAATQLSNYLLQLNHGQILVGVSADEPSLHLSNALSTLRQFFQVEVSNVQRRGSFAFVAQKGFPRKTRVRRVNYESTSPAYVSVSVRGITVHVLAQ